MATSIQLIVKRTLAHWRLLSAVVIGVTLAVTIMSSSVVYFEALRDLALDRSLERVNPSELDVLIEAGQTPTNPESNSRLVDAMNGTIVRRLSPYMASTDHATKSWTFFIDRPPIMVPEGQCPCRPGARGTPNELGQLVLECDCGRIAFLALPDVESRVTLLSGSHPQEVTEQPAGEDQIVIDALIDREAAELYDLTVGSTMVARAHWEDRRRLATARVTGIYERTEPDDPFWEAMDRAFGTRGGTLQFAQFVVPEASLLEGLGGYFTEMGSDYVWFLDTDPGSIHATDTAAIRSTLTTSRNELQAVVDGFLMRTTLPDVLLDFDTELFFNRLPMFIVLILIVLVVLYYVVTLATLLVDAQRGEVALLRSRGATSRQILAVFVVEALLLAGFAVLIGPLIALGAVALIGVLPFYAELNDGVALPVRLTGAVYRMALLGGGLSLLALFLPALRATRLGLLTDRRSRARPPRLAFVQRYYLDLGFLGLVLFLFWQLTKQGSFVAVSLFGETAVNNLILAVPAIFLVAAGLALLRLFPLLMDLLGRAFSSRYMHGIVPPSIVLGIWQMARNPAHHSRLSLLLILTAGLGVFAASFASTLERSARERVLYESAADLRATGVNVQAGGLSYDIAQRLSDVNGVEAVTPVYRETGLRSVGASSLDSFTVLGVNPEQVDDVAWFREDFAASGVADILADVGAGGRTGIELPREARWLTMRIKPLSRQPDVSLIARLSDANGRFYTLRLSDLTPVSVDHNRFNCATDEPDSPPDWCRIGASVWPTQIGSVPGLAAVPPLRLHSIGVAVMQGGDGMGPNAIDIDDISVLIPNSGAGELVTVEAFDTPDGWRTLRPTAESLGDLLSQPSDENGHPIPGVVRFRWTEANAREYRGLGHGESPDIPVLASSTFLDRFGVSVGEVVSATIEGAPVTLKIVSQAEYFPTLNPEQQPFVITDITAVHERLNIERLLGDRQPNEFWISTTAGRAAAASPEGIMDAYVSPDPALDDVQRRLSSMRLRAGPVIDRSALLNDVAIDPLVSAGWKALLGMAFLTVLIVSAIGFLVHARVSFDARRGELALLRTIGLSMRQLLGLVLLEQLIVIGAAVGLGIFMGTRLGNTIMPYLANSGENISAVPPMLIDIDWAGFGITFGLLGAVFAAVVAALLVAVYRMSIHRIMRMGEG